MIDKQRGEGSDHSIKGIGTHSNTGPLMVHPEQWQRLVLLKEALRLKTDLAADISIVASSNHAAVSQTAVLDDEMSDFRRGACHREQTTWSPTHLSQLTRWADSPDVQSWFQWIQKAQVSQDPLLPIRVARLAHALNLKPPMLLAGKELSHPQQHSGDLSPSLNPNITAQESEEQKKNLEKEQELMALQAKLRQLVAQDVGWAVIKPYCWKLYQLKGGAVAAAELVEMAFLYGSIHETIDVVIALAEQGQDFYFCLHKKLREHLAVRLWSVKRQKLLKKLLKSSRGTPELLPAEHLFLFYELFEAQLKSDAFMYFQHYESDILEGVKRFGSKLKIDQGEFYFEMANLALSAGYENKGRELLERLMPDHKLYGDAVQILMVLNRNKNNPACDSLFRTLHHCKDWRARVDKIKEYLEACRMKAHQSDLTRPAVNDIVSDPLKWVPQNPMAWSKVSALISANLDLYRLLPSISRLFRDHILRFHIPALDLALWEGPLYHPTGVAALAQYWEGVALLHKYFAEAKADEVMLWKARSLIASADQTSPIPLPLRWSELQRGLIRALGCASHIGQKRRQEMIRQIKVASEGAQLSAQDIMEYLNESEHISYDVLTRLQKVCERKNDPAVEIRLIRLKAQKTHYATYDLQRLWQRACEKKNDDLAWRVATILQSRGKLAKIAFPSWSISGEKRSEYELLNPSPSALSLATWGMTELQRRFCDGLLKVGPYLPELFAAIDDNVQVIKSPQPPAGSFEARVEQALLKSKWLVQRKYLYRFRFDGILNATIQLPDFVDVLPNNTWSYLFVRLADRLGLNAWEWTVSKLKERLDELLPKTLGSYKLKYSSHKVAKWMRQLNVEQKIAWKNLIQSLDKVNDEDAVIFLATYLARVSILVYPAHYEAIDSLHKMRVPIKIIWDTETWLLSEEYDQYRKNLQIDTRIPVPHNLQSASVIVS